MGIVQKVRKDIAAFFAFLIDANLAKDCYEDGNIEVTADSRWVLTNIAEILSTDGIVCYFIETTDTNGEDGKEEVAVATCKLCIAVG